MHSLVLLLRTNPTRAERQECAFASRQAKQGWSKGTTRVSKTAHGENERKRYRESGLTRADTSSTDDHSTDPHNTCEHSSTTRSTFAVEIKLCHAHTSHEMRHKIKAITTVMSSNSLHRAQHHAYQQQTSLPVKEPLAQH